MSHIEDEVLPDACKPPAPGGRRKRRTTVALMDRAAPQTISPKRVRQLALMGLTPQEIAAQLGCPPERLWSPEMLALIAKADVDGVRALLDQLWAAAKDGRWLAIKFLIKHSERVREAALEDASARREELWEEKFRAREAGQTARVEEIASEIDAIHEFIKPLCIDFRGELVVAREPKRRGQAKVTAWERHLERMAAHRSEEFSRLDPEEFERQFEQFMARQQE